MAKRRKGKTVKAESVIAADIEKTKAAIERQLAALAPKMREMIHRSEQQRAEYQRSSAALDRALRDPTGLISFQKKQRKKQRKKKPAPVGRPPKYDLAAIHKIAEDYIADHGVPDKLALLYEKVSDRCTDSHIPVPGDTRFKEILSPIWSGAKRKRAVAK